MNSHWFPPSRETYSWTSTGSVPSVSTLKGIPNCGVLSTVLVSDASAGVGRETSAGRDEAGRPGGWAKAGSTAYTAHAVAKHALQRNRMMSDSLRHGLQVFRRAAPGESGADPCGFFGRGVLSLE